MALLSRHRLLSAGALIVSMACATGSGTATTRGAFEVAPGVFMLRGSGGEVAAENRGRIGNAGFIVGDRGVVVIDTGTSYRHGVALLDEVRRVTAQPVQLVVVTQARQEFLFGSAAFRERGIPIHMHRDAARLMAARCEGCLQTLRLTLGDKEMKGTAVIAPDVAFEAAEVVVADIGRPVRVLHFGHSSGPGDVVVLDERSGTLFAGGLLANGRVPDVQDADLDGWKRALLALRALPLRTIVPGHGPPAKLPLVDTVARYLASLRDRVAALLAAGAPLSEVPDAAALPAFEAWDQYAIIHRRNASIVFLRLERDQLLK